MPIVLAIWETEAGAEIFEARAAFSFPLLIETLGPPAFLKFLLP